MFVTIDCQRVNVSHIVSFDTTIRDLKQLYGECRISFGSIKSIHPMRGFRVTLADNREMWVRPRRNDYKSYGDYERDLKEVEEIHKNLMFYSNHN